MASRGYTQLGIGDCGHIVQLWPAVTPIGGKSEYVCEECTRALWGIDGAELIHVWVRAEPFKPEIDPKPKKRGRPKKAEPVIETIPAF